jgi:hypothetical protein
MQFTCLNGILYVSVTERWNSKIIGKAHHHDRYAGDLLMYPKPHASGE